MGFFCDTHMGVISGHKGWLRDFKLQHSFTSIQVGQGVKQLKKKKRGRKNGLKIQKTRAPVWGNIETWSFFVIHAWGTYRGLRPGSGILWYCIPSLGSRVANLKKGRKNGFQYQNRHHLCGLTYHHAVLL